MLRINLTSVPVSDQDRAQKFYTEKLGFILKHDIPMGEYKWLTVVSSDDQSSVELLLEPMAFEPAQVFQKSLKEAGIPYTSFAVDDLEKEYKRLIDLGVEFTTKPQEAGPVMIAVLDDTCGNYIQLVQEL